MSSVTKVEVYPLKERKGKILAIGRVVFNDDIVVDGIKVIEGKKGRFVGMPSRKTREGNYSDIVYLNTDALKKEVTQAVLTKLSEGPEDNQPSSEDDDLPF